MIKLAFIRILILSLSAFVAQQKTGTLKGRIEDGKGKPINKAEVRVMNSRDRSIKETATDASGNYSFELEPGDYTVTFDAEGFQGGTLVSMQQVEEGKETRVKTIQLQKAKRTSLVRGIVFDASGFGLAGAKVKLERVPTEEEEKEGEQISAFNRDYTTNSRGEFAFRLPPARARYRVTAMLSGYAPDTKTVDVGENEAVPVALTLVPLKKE